MSKKHKTTTAIAILKVFAAILAILLTNSLAIYPLWNWLIPDIFGLPSINFWQSFGLVTMFACLCDLNAVISIGRKDGRV